MNMPAAQRFKQLASSAQRIAGNAPLAVRAVKRLVTQGMDMPLVHAL